MMNTDKLKELLAAATPGPWAVCQDPPPNPYWQPGFTIGAADPKDARRVCDTSLLDWRLGRANAALIVAAVNALPSLIARLEAAEKDAGRWRHARKLLTIDDIEGAQGAFDSFGGMVSEEECARADAAIDGAKGASHGP